jgi:radical SAM protein with 4Fe4S-binding SPASM domain
MSRYLDKFNLIKLLNAKRILNLFLLGTSFELQKIRKNGQVSALPFALSIEPTTACNLGCPECPSGLKQFTRPTGKLSHKLHNKILDEVKSHVFYINYYFQGEPFLHPDFLKLIQDAKKRKIYTATSTNAHFIDEKKAEEIVASGLDRLIISLDGLTQKSYEQYRINGNLEKVLEATKHLVSAKEKLKSQTPHLIFQFLAVSANEQDIPQLFERAKEMKVDEVRVKTAQFYSFENGNPLMPKDEKYSRYTLGSDGKYKLKNKLKNECWRMWSGSVITWDGKTVPCCFDKDALHQLGDLTNSTFKSIWQSKEYISFRKSVFTNRQEIDICKNCTEGTKVYS